MSKSGRSLVPALAVAGFVAAVHLVWWGLGDATVRYGAFPDGDSYMRLVRVERLLETGDWFDVSVPRANAPAGGSLHWTRPLDVLLLALALPMKPLLGIKAALFWSGAVISPILHVVMALALAWAATPLIGRTGGLIAGGLTAIQFGILGYALVGHADHHVLLGLLAVVTFGFTVRALMSAATGDGGIGQAFAAGVALAAGTWVGTEMQIPMALAMLALGVPWLLADDGAGKRSLSLALGAVGGLTLALLVERGPGGFFAVEHDRVSVVHLTQAALIAGFWSAMASLDRRGRVPGSAGGRVALAAGGAATAASVMWFVFPKILVDPLKDFDPLILKIFAGIKEYVAIDGAAHFVLYLGVVLIAVPWAMRRLADEWPGPARWAWGLLLASVLLYTVMAVNWIRWTFYAEMFAVVALADLLVRVDRALDRRFAYPGRVAAKVGALTLLAAGPVALGMLWVYAVSPKPAEPLAAIGGDPRGCPLKPLAKFLDRPPWSERQRTILSSANFGPEILYRTRHRVTATLHHRTATGLLASARILGGVDDEANRALIERFGVELVIVCPHPARDAYMLIGTGEAALARRLIRGEVPPWLTEVDLPDGLAGRFRMFEVRPR